MKVEFWTIDDDNESTWMTVAVEEALKAKKDVIELNGLCLAMNALSLMYEDEMFPRQLTMEYLLDRLEGETGIVRFSHDTPGLYAVYLMEDLDTDKKLLCVIRSKDGSLV